MSRIKVIGYEESEGKLREIYDGLISSRGKLADVHMIQSLRPESIVKHMELYMEIMFSKSELSRAQREMVAVIVSATNSCAYCQIHHGEALNHYWKDEARVLKLRADYTTADLTEQDAELCVYAEKLTKNPALSEKTDLTQELRKVGLSDSAILDASLVIAYFNFVNRLVLGLGVHIEDHSGEGFKY